MFVPVPSSVFLAIFLGSPLILGSMAFLYIDDLHHKPGNDRFVHRVVEMDAWEEHHGKFYPYDQDWVEDPTPTVDIKNPEGHLRTLGLTTSTVMVSLALHDLISSVFVAATPR